MKNQAQKLTLIAITIALLIVGGGVIYSVSYLLGGSQIIKILLMSLYFSILLYLLILRCSDIGTLTTLSIVLGLILSVFSPLMTLAIILSGVFTDLTSYLMFKGYGKDKQKIISIGFYPLYSVVFSLLVTSALTIRFHNTMITFIVYILGGLAAFILGIIGGYLGYYLNNKYIHLEKQFNTQK